MNFSKDFQAKRKIGTPRVTSINTSNSAVKKTEENNSSEITNAIIMSKIHEPFANVQLVSRGGESFPRGFNRAKKFFVIFAFGVGE
jgi:hypothetical protein